MSVRELIPGEVKLVGELKKQIRLLQWQLKEVLSHVS